jgi:hypothetical protein
MHVVASGRRTVHVRREHHDDHFHHRRSDDHFGSRHDHHHANEGGGAVFFVGNDRTGTMAVERSTLRRNPSAGFETPGDKGIFFLGAADPAVTASTIQ